jgi:excinuclease UvrABC helicase subunit UvrB
MTIEEAFAEAKRRFPNDMPAVSQRIDSLWNLKFVHLHEVTGYGKDFESALEMVAPRVKTPTQIAADKRTQAAALLAEADALEGKATP